MMRPDPRQFDPQPEPSASMHPVEYILLVSVAIGLIAFLGLAWRAVT